MIARLAQEALLEEVYTTPKPGLVDCHDTGAHTDMDCRTFEKSAAAIAPYIAAMYELGGRWRGAPQALFCALRPLGLQAEQAMLAATDGVNTHKGAIFTFAILAAAAGHCAVQDVRLTPQLIGAYAAKMTREPLEREFAAIHGRMPKTHGEVLYCKYGIKGVRGQAQQGFPVITNLLCPLLQGLRRQGCDPQRVNLQLLLESMAVLEDTCILSRGTSDDLAWIQRQAAALLAQGGAFAPDAAQKLLALNAACVQRNISPGGSADFLAAALFLEKLIRREDYERNGSHTDRYAALS